LYLCDIRYREQESATLRHSGIADVDHGRQRGAQGQQRAIFWGKKFYTSAWMIEERVTGAYLPQKEILTAKNRAGDAAGSVPVRAAGSVGAHQIAVDFGQGAAEP
jgi:hypothetical protein